MALSVAVRQFHTLKARLLRRLVKAGQGTVGLSFFGHVLQTVRKCKKKTSSAKLSSRSISKAVRSVIRVNVLVRSADHVKSSLQNASRSN